MLTFSDGLQANSCYSDSNITRGILLEQPLVNLEVLGWPVACESLISCRKDFTT